MSSDKKVVVDEVSGWLRVFDDGTVDRTWTGPPEALPLMEPVPPYDTPKEGVTVHDLLDVDPTLRLYIPAAEVGGSGEKLPVLLHLHGGGFCISRPSWRMYHAFYSRLARSLPAIVVSPSLPLAPEHRLPAAIDAAHSALLLLLEGKLEAAGGLLAAADLSRVFLIGDSSGGNLVHQVASRAGEEVAGGIVIHPGFVRAERSRSEREEAEDPFLTLDMLDKFAGYGLPEGARRDHPIMCPMGEQAPPLEGVRLPPYLVAVAERDLVRDTNMEFCEAMERAGKEVVVVVSEGVGHCFYLNAFAVDSDPVVGKRTQELIMAIKDFVDRH